MNNNAKYNSIGGILAVAILSIAALILIFKTSHINADTALPVVTVYKSPTCGCCKKWVSHLESNGFKVDVNNLSNLDLVKKKFGIEPQFQSCHTAKIGNYVVEGHVPATDIKKMLAEKPDIYGLAVPGMPMGSPGMEGSRKDNYNVLAIKNGASPTIFSSH
jgi:hypothetical protein